MNQTRPAGWQRTPGSSTSLKLDKKSLIEIYDNNYQALYRYIYRQIGDVETSRELTSEVFSRLLQTVQDKQLQVQRVTPWLYCTAHNLVIDHYRSQQHRRHLPLRENLVESSMKTPEIVENRLSAIEVREALQALTPEQRQVILLKYLEGMTNHEVAELMGKSVGAVKSLQHRALNALHKILTENKEMLAV